ncbi:MAG: PilC/PilY family type IV pilus protein [Rhodocyclaceae bacterium]|nr:PilC/PilY family type IV pilus protein [Rhodocyclaceae bacterium]
MAAAIASNINKCTAAATGNCQASGYTAYSSGSTVTIAAPLPANITYTPVITSTAGGMTLTPSAFAVGNVPGANLLTVITADRNSYPYPGTSAKASTRTDCAGTTCTYNEEMTNYANWWAYYRTRMQMVKTAASQSFASIGTNYRVGYLSINNNTGSDFINLDTFNAANKHSWYVKFFNANPGNSTPLRVTLAKAGRLYAGKLNGTTLNGSTVVDPMLYSCQQNFTILSTDGYWNESSTPVQLNGSTSIGNQDGADVRPYSDGATVTYSKSTSQLQYSQTQLTQATNQVQSRTTQIQSSTSSLQKQTTQLQTQTSTLQQQISQLQGQTSTLQQQMSQLQGQTSSLQSQTSQLQGQTSSLQSQTSQLQGQTSNLQTQTSQLQKQTSQLQKQTKSGGSWGAWTDVTSGSCTVSSTVHCQYVVRTTTGVSSCTVVVASSGSPYTVLNPVACNTVVTSAYANAASCTANATPDGSGNTTQCRYTTWTGTMGLPSCTNAAQSSGPNYTVGTAYRNCTTVVTSAYANASSCTATTTPDSSGYTTQCQYTTWSGTVGLPNCTNTAPSSGPNYTVGTAYRNCTTVVTAPYANVSSCTATTTPNSSGNTTQCQYSAWSGWMGTSACTAVAPSSGPSYTVATAKQCQTVVTTPYANVSSCTATTTPNSSGNTTQCQYTAWSGWAGIGSCTAAAQSSGPSYTVATARQCQTVVTTPFGAASSCTATTTPDAGGNTTQCQYSAWSAWSGTGSCTPVAQSGGPNYTVATARNCQSAVTSPYANAGSCTTNATPDGSGNTTQCQYTAWTAWANAGSCTSLGQSGASPYSVGTATQCRTTDTGWVGASACSPSAANGQTITCQALATGPTPVASCTPQTATSGNAWLQITCPVNSVVPAVGVASCTADPPTAANNYVSTNCTTVTTGPTSSSTCTPTAAASSNQYTTTTCSVSSMTGGSSNTLADVAEYYYQTDLRTSSLGNCTGAPVPPATAGNDVCTNNVPTSGQDAASWQHMTTFTLGLGASGFMQFSPSYATASSGDYYSVKNGLSADPTNGICSWQSSGVCNWPIPTSNTQTTIDDLWHAAVDGRGAYFSATNPSSLAAGLSGALAGVSARLGASAAATTSNPNVTSGDNFVFSSTFTTQDWTGQLYRQQIDLTTGVVPAFDINNLSTYDWAAQGALDGNSARTIYTYDSSSSAAASKLKPFAWGSLTTAEQAYFQTANISSLSQFCAAGVTCLSAADQTAAAGANLVAFLAGDRSNEGVATDITKYYRQRAHLLGDIVNAEAVYVKTPLYTYADANYADFTAANASRQGMVYAASNDGMLHAFNASTGAEVWAYVPAMVLPNLYKLADKNYAALHQYFVDGTPTSGDICPNAPASTCSVSQWKTIIVGGMNRGGRGYYAMDITNPAAPKLMWEFSDTNMGYTYGNPLITKLVDGTWVVLVTSGYNNITPGDGVGRLYVLNANTGALIRSISTGVGDTTTPSGVAHINAWADNAMSDNTALRVYGGDLLGNLWRFDINDNVGASGYEAERLVTFYGNAAGTTVQPITTKPELGDVGGYAVVFVGTGRYLGTSDLADTSLQSFYAVKDRMATPPVAAFANPRASGSGFVQQTETNTTCPTGTPATICTTGQSVRVSTSNAVNFASDNGWFLDLPDSGERSNTDPTLALGTLGFTTNVPNVSACTAGGYSYRYFLDYRTGAAVSTSTTQVVAAKLGNALATRGVFVRLPNNTVVQLTRMSDGTTVTSNVPIGSGSGTLRRISWRELVNE